MAHVLEVEHKYDAGPSLPALDDLPSVEAVEDAGEHELAAVYFDTAGLDLKHAGITLRRREGGDDDGWHLKLPAGEDRRLEVQVPLSRAARSVPKELRAAVTAYTGGRPLHPVATIVTRRRTLRLVGDAGAVLAELVDDHVTATALGEDGGTADPQHWREWEVELKDGDESLLAAVGERLRGAGGERAAVGSKLARALGGRAVRRTPQPAAQPGPDSSTTDLVRARLVELVDEVPGRDVAVRRDLPDGVHDLRVTIRRIRQLLASFKPVLDPDAVRRLRDELAWVADLLGEARDAEVVLARLEDALAGQPDDVGAPAAARAVRTAMTARYRAAHQSAVIAMESDRYLALLGALRELAAAPPFRDDAGRPVRDVVPKLLRRDVKRLERRMRRLDDAPEAERVERMHEARKAAKRVRYTAEALRPVYGKPARKLARSMKAFSTYVGDHHDAVMTREAVRVLAAEAGPAGRVAFVLGRIDVLQEQGAEATEQGLGKAWKKARPGKPWTWAV